MYFDQKLSKKGALNCISKKPRQITLEDLHNNRPIISPHALPMFKEARTLNPDKQYKKIRMDSAMSHKPEQPVQGEGGGRAGGTALILCLLVRSGQGRKDREVVDGYVVYHEHTE